MSEEETLDFKALRAKFQLEDIPQKQLRAKPALPEKPRVIPPPQSPTHLSPTSNSHSHYLPAGARPSLLTSINQSLDGKTPVAPKVVFKDDKKESKKPLIQPSPKAKDKSESKLSKSKDKAAKGSKDKLDGDVKSDVVEQKLKTKSSKSKKLLISAGKESTAELVPADPPPKATTSKKKSILNFKRSGKKEVPTVPADPILDTPSPDISGPSLLIPTPEETEETPAGPAEIQKPQALMPPTSAIPDSYTPPAVVLPSLVTVIPPPEISPPPAFIPDIPASELPSVELETPPEEETAALPVSVTPTPAIPSPAPSPSSSLRQQASPTPPPAAAPSASPPPPAEPAVEAVAAAEVVDETPVEEPPPPVIDPPSVPPSPESEQPISALSALERAEEMSPAKRTAPCDQRIVNALEKARRKYNSPLHTPSTSTSVTPLPEEHPPPISPTQSFPDLPPIDYDDQTKGTPVAIPAQINGFDHETASPMLEGIAEEGGGILPDVLIVPPPPPKKPLPEPESLGPAPEKPDRPPSVDLTPYLPPHEEQIAVEIPAPQDFCEIDNSEEVPALEEEVPELQNPEVAAWGNDQYADEMGQVPDGPSPPDDPNVQVQDNEIVVPGAEASGTSEFGVEFPEVPEAVAAPDRVDSSSPASADTLIDSVPQVLNGTHENGENGHEDAASSSTKKKAKGEGKKRKGPPKNPYAETLTPTQNDEKSKVSKFGKNDKKSPEGPDEKELKKKEKQRLEKEKKELKEQKEREKKEQKEKEKKENEMKKKFKITGSEEAMYKATVKVASKGRKNDLPVNAGDVITIIRTNNCPKGKWLARDDSNTYGYIALDNVELDIQEMLALGKKAATDRKSSGNTVEADATSLGSRASNHYPLSAGSFSDDSEEWTCDDDEPLSPSSATADPITPQGHTRTNSMPETSNAELNVNHQHSHSDLSPEASGHSQARVEALQKLATFFSPTSPLVKEEPPASTEDEQSPVIKEEEDAASAPPEPSSTEKVEDAPEMLILPPPDMYADVIAGE